MSQEKVDRHKEEKANRKKIMRREKIISYLQRTVVGLIAIALVAWVGFSAYNMYESSRTAESTEIDYTAFFELSESIGTDEG